MKKLMRISLLAVLFISIMCISSYASNDVSVQDEIIDGLFSSIDTTDNTSYTIKVDGSKLISLLSTSQTDDVIYNNLYIKLPDSTKKAVVTYADKSTSDLKIITAVESQYAICPVPVLTKINQSYYPAFLNNLKSNNSSANSGTVEFFSEDNSSLGSLSFNANLDQNTFSGAKIYIDSTSTDSYQLDSKTGIITLSETYNRIMANGDCTVHVLLKNNIGDTITIEPFGTLTYVGTSDSDSTYTHEYSAKISDKKILNENIFGSFVSDSNSILQVYELNFEGDLIKDDVVPSEKVSVTDPNTNVSIEANAGIIPDDTTLNISKVTDESKIEEFKNIVGNVKFTAYNISLLSNNVSVQPTGKLNLSIPIPTGYDRDNLIVYRINSDGTKTDFTVTVKGDFAVIETDHFSEYLIAEKATSSDSTNTNVDTTTDTTTDSEEQNTKLDNEPKTGINNPTKFVIGTLICAFIGLGICMKKMSK